MPSFPKEVALAEEPAARQSVVGFLRNVNRKSTAVTQDDLWEMIDTDKDGATDADELAAGTDPKDPNSVFLLQPNVRTTSLGPELKWSSVAEKSYLVQRTPALGQAFETVSGPIPATPPLNTFVDKTAPLGQGFFYRILKP